MFLWGLTGIPNASLLYNLYLIVSGEEIRKRLKEEHYNNKKRLLWITVSIGVVVGLIIFILLVTRMELEWGESILIALVGPLFGLIAYWAAIESGKELWHHYKELQMYQNDFEVFKKKEVKLEDDAYLYEMAQQLYFARYEVSRRSLDYNYEVLDFAASHNICQQFMVDTVKEFFNGMVKKHNIVKGELVIPRGKLKRQMGEGVTMLFNDIQS